MTVKLYSIVIIYLVQVVTLNLSFKTKPFFSNNVKSSKYLLSEKTNILGDINLLLDKGLDTAEDVVLHTRRYIASLANQTTPSQQEKDKSTLPTVLVLGSGWSAHAFLKVIDAEKFNVICISPRSYFIFTPMLSATAVGTVEYRSIIEPIRATNPFIEYIEGEVMDINPYTQEVIITSNLSTQLQLSPSAATVNTINTSNNDKNNSNDINSTTTTNNNNNKKSSFIMKYDHMIYCIGAKVGDFGIPGVQQYCHFIKEIEDVKMIKNKIVNIFEYASLPTTPSDIVTNLLNFIVVGGGPSGVEFAGELSDFIRNDIAKLYPKLLPFVNIVLLNSGSTILTAFDTILQTKALNLLQQEGIEIKLNTRVLSVEDSYLTYSTRNDPSGSATNTLNYGLCIWAAGVAPRPLTQQLAQKLGQDQMDTVKKTGRIKVDPWMRVIHPYYEMPNIRKDKDKSTIDTTTTTIDTTTINSEVSADSTLTTMATTSNNNTTTSSDSTINEDNDSNSNDNKEYIENGSIFILGDSSYYTWTTPLAAVEDNITFTNITTTTAPLYDKQYEQVMKFLSGNKIYGGLMTSSTSLPQTAQVAGQQGAYVARLFNRGYRLNTLVPSYSEQDTNYNLYRFFRTQGSKLAKPFYFLNLGLLAYIGDSQAVAQIELGESSLLQMTGDEAYLLWRSVYLVKQVSARTRFLVLFDFIKTKLFGRDLSGI